MSSPAAKKIAVLFTTLAGSGRAALLAQKIAARLQQAQTAYTLYDTQWPAHFEGYTDIYIAGGDGTLNFFINKYRQMTLPLIVFKGGTGNDFHWMLYGAMDFEAQWTFAIEAAPRPIDIGRCNDRYFMNEAGIGFEGSITRALTGKKKRPGKASFLITILKKILHYRCAYYTIEADGKKWEGKKLLIDICNGSRAGGGFMISPLSKADDGFLNLVIAGELNPWKRLRYLPVMEKGKHLELDFIDHQYIKKIRILGNHSIQYHLDGEYQQAEALDIEVLHGHFFFRF
jgi:diacylglycerol kinase (ATP)